MLLVELAGTANSLKNHNARPNPYHNLVVMGKTKGNQSLVAKFTLPIALITKGMGIKQGKWLKQLVKLIHRKVKGVEDCLNKTLTLH